VNISQLKLRSEKFDDDDDDDDDDNNNNNNNNNNRKKLERKLLLCSRKDEIFAHLNKNYSASG
jgi:hypothetical protein